MDSESCPLNTDSEIKVTMKPGQGHGFVFMVRTAVLILWTLKILYAPAGVSAITLPPVSWNSSNPMFKSSKNDHVIQVKPYDDLDFVCPYHRHPEVDRSTGEEEEGKDEELNGNEYYVIYMVAKVEYDDCNIYSESQSVMMLNCSNPRHRKRFTILFEPFPSIPNVPEYQPGSIYYFISTSTGTKDGLGNLYQGACSHQNMKLTIKICCDQNALKHTNAILPEMTSGHARKHGHHYRSHSSESTNHRRIQHHLMEEHNGKHRSVETIPLSTVSTTMTDRTRTTRFRPFLGLSSLEPADNVNHEKSRESGKQQQTSLISIQDAIQDSLVHHYSGGRGVVCHLRAETVFLASLIPFGLAKLLPL